MHSIRVWKRWMASLWLKLNVFLMVAMMSVSTPSGRPLYNNNYSTTWLQFDLQCFYKPGLRLVCKNPYETEKDLSHQRRCHQRKSISVYNITNYSSLTVKYFKCYFYLHIKKMTERSKKRDIIQFSSFVVMSIMVSHCLLSCHPTIADYKKIHDNSNWKDLAFKQQPHPAPSFFLLHSSPACCFCLTLPPRSACGRRPVCQQRGLSPHTQPPGQEGSLEGTPAQSGSRLDPPQRWGPQQEHPDQYLKKSCWGLWDIITPFSSNLIPLLQLHPSDSLRGWDDNTPLFSPSSHRTERCSHVVWKSIYEKLRTAAKRLLYL